MKHRNTESGPSSKSSKETEQALQLLWKESGVKDYVLKYNLTSKERMNKPPPKAKSSSKLVSSNPEDAKGTEPWKRTPGMFRRVDKDATYEAIQSTWKNRARGGVAGGGPGDPAEHVADVLSVCETINQLLDHPIMLNEDHKAAMLIQKRVRGWQLRTRRARGELFPVEEQAMADSRVMLSIYGARVFSLAPRERRTLVIEHYASRKIAGALRKFCAALRERKNSTSSKTAAAIKIQKSLRGHWSRKFVRLNRRHLSRASYFLEFRACDLDSISRDYLSRLQTLAACCLQASARRRLDVVEMDKERRNRREAATTLQSQVRAHMARIALEKTISDQLTRRILRFSSCEDIGSEVECRHWNKVMWTMCSPDRYLLREARRMGKPAVDDSVIATCIGEVRRSLWLNDSVDHSLVSDQPLLSSCGLQVVEVQMTSDQHGADDSSVRTSWKILPSRESEEIILGGAKEGEAAAEPKQQQHQSTPRIVCDVTKEYKEANVCMDGSVFFKAILAERRAIVLQSSYRCHQARAKRRFWQKERGDHAARRGSQPDHSSSPSSSSPSRLDSSQQEVSTPSMRSPTSRSPTARGMSRAQSREVLAEWKKGIEEKVSTIHEQLTDSARKRFLSKSPPASRLDVDTALLLSPDPKGGGPPVVLTSPSAASAKLMSLPHLPSPSH